MKHLLNIDQKRLNLHSMYCKGEASVRAYIIVSELGVGEDLFDAIYMTCKQRRYLFSGSFTRLWRLNRCIQVTIHD